MVIFHSYVKLPEGIYVSHLMFQKLSPTHSRCRSQPPLTCSGGYSLRPPNRPGPSGPKANSHLGWWVVMRENPQCQTFKRGWKTWPKWWTKKKWRLDGENQRNPEISRGYTVYPTSRLADQKKLRAPPPRSSVGLPTGAAAELLPIQHGHMYLMAELIVYIYVHDCTRSYVLIILKILHSGGFSS